MSDIADRQPYNPDPNWGGCCLTSFEEPGVSFRGVAPFEMYQSILFIGTTALHEAVSAFYDYTVDDVKERLTKDGNQDKKENTKLKAQVAKLNKQLATWEKFRQGAADAGLVIDL